MVISEADFSQALKQGSMNVFEEAYKFFFKPLHCYAYTIVKDEYVAEEIVQQLFLKLWEKKTSIDIQTSIKAYLYKAVYFDSLNYLKHEKVKSTYQSHTKYVMKDNHEHSTSEKLYHRNLEERLRSALNELPEQCRTVFQLSRFEELKYREIAAKLGISEKTVENHMGKALKMLRIKLVDFVTIIILGIIHFKNMFH